MQIQSIPIKSITFGSLFKLIFFAGFFCWFLFGLIGIILSLIAPSALTVNDQAATGLGDGIKFFFICILLGSVLAAFTSVLGALCLKLVSKIINLGNLSHIDEDATSTFN